MNPLVVEGPRHVALNMLGRSKKYLEALVDSTFLFGRGAPEIHHDKPEAYYECLYKLKDLAALHRRPDFATLGQRQFQALLRGDLPEVDMPAALGDVLEPDVEPPDRLAIADGAVSGDEDANVEPAPVPVAPGVLVPVAMAVGVPNAFELLAPVHFEGLTCRFDNFSHTSGQLRCYVKCLHSGHHACFRYAQTNQFPTTKELLAYLFAWAQLSSLDERMPRGSHQERRCNPTPSQVRRIMDLLP